MKLQVCTREEYEGVYLYYLESLDLDSEDLVIFGSEHMVPAYLPRTDIQQTFVGVDAKSNITKKAFELIISKFMEMPVMTQVLDYLQMDKNHPALTPADVTAVAKDKGYEQVLRLTGRLYQTDRYGLLQVQGHEVLAKKGRGVELRRWQKHIDEVETVGHVVFFGENTTPDIFLHGQHQLNAMSRRLEEIGLLHFGELQQNRVSVQPKPVYNVFGYINTEPYMVTAETAPEDLQVAAERIQVNIDGLGRSEALDMIYEEYNKRAERQRLDNRLFFLLDEQFVTQAPVKTDDMREFSFEEALPYLARAHGQIILPGNPLIDEESFRRHAKWYIAEFV